MPMVGHSLFDAYYPREAGHDDDAFMSNPGAFIFAEDGVRFFPTIDETAGWVGAIDLEGDVYEAFISLDGERLVPSINVGGTVQLARSGEHDRARLIALLERQRATRGGFTSDPRDPVAVANELLAGAWAVRWPKWPRWLDKWIHGTEPPRVGREA